MPDTNETKILKDINRHLAHMDDGAAGGISPTEMSSLNKNATEIIANFASIISAETKSLISAGNKQLIEAFGDLKGFDTEAQADLLDDVVDELKTNNRFAAKSEHNDFLDEAEREQDLNINRRTNELLEDLNDKEDDAADASARAESSSGGMGGLGMGGLFGGLMAGKSIKGLLGGIKNAGKKLFFPALIAAAGGQFLRGWAEAGDDASTAEKFNKGISKTLSSITFGLIPEKVFDDLLVSIETAIKKSWQSFASNWNDYISGKIGGTDFFANMISDLMGGGLSPEQVKKIGDEMKKGLSDVVDTLMGAIVSGFIDPLAVKLDEQLGLLLRGDLIGFIKQRIARNKIAEQTVEDAERGLRESRPEGLGSEKARKFLEDQGILIKQSQEEKDFRHEVDRLKRDRERIGAISDERLRKYDIKNAERIKKYGTPEILAEIKRSVKAQDKKAAEVNLIQEKAIENLRKSEQSLTDAIKRLSEKESGGNAMQINNNTSVANAVDTQTENDDQMNLLRSSRLAQ
jgi:hypothetical protein